MWVRDMPRRSVFITLLLSYMAIFLLPLVIGSIFYTKTESTMIDNANRANLAMLEQLRQVMDNKLKEVDQISQQIALNPRLHWLLNNADTLRLQDRYKFVEFIRNDMARYKNVSDIVSDYYVYFRANDTVVLPSAKTNARMLFDQYFQASALGYRSWLDILRNYHYKEFIPLTYDTSSGKLETITYIQSLPLGETTEILGSLVILLDMGQVRGMLEKIESLNQSSVFILDQNDRVIIENGKHSLPWDEIRHEVHRNDMPYRYKDHDMDMMLSYIESEQNGWKYILTMPTNVYMERVNSLKNWALSLLLICLVGGGAAISFWLHRNYAPLREVVHVLQQQKPARNKRLANEYDFIRETIQMTINEERELRNILDRQTPVIRANFLSRFIRGHVDVSSMTEESLKFMKVRLISEYFAVVLIDIADFSRFSSDQSERQWALVRFIISNISNDLIRERHWGYSVELDRHRVALLINISRERYPQAMEDLEHIATRLKEVMEERFKTFITVAIGEIHEGLGNIGDSYFEALNALDYKMYRGKNAIIRYREIAEADRHYYYPIETEIQLINFTKSGDVDNAEKLINNIFEMHFGMPRMTPELGKSLLFNMVSTLWKIVNPMDPLYAEVFGDRFDPIKELSDCTTVEEMKMKIREWFLTLSTYLKENRSEHSRQLTEKIAQYIERHYGDSMLSLTAIAEHFQLTPQYLSTFFKKQTGMNLTDYISRVRIEQAKKLMRDKTLTFTQIANKVGYANDIGFIRVFKKYEGTTPGKYRQTLYS